MPRGDGCYLQPELHVHLAEEGGGRHQVLLALGGIGRLAVHGEIADEPERAPLGGRGLVGLGSKVVGQRNFLITVCKDLQYSQS